MGLKASASDSVRVIDEEGGNGEVAADMNESTSVRGYTYAAAADGDMQPEWVWAAPAALAGGKARAGVYVQQALAPRLRARISRSPRRARRARPAPNCKQPR